ncbi:hypothetical protein [Nocardia sp. CA-119907]|uniref:hypothetical protein n=1 Tax=Nocardia sp. CA-119907 TaxID=3239973 RepID=UPI003D95EE82
MITRTATAAFAVLAGAALIIAVRAARQLARGLDCSGGYGSIGTYEDWPTNSPTTEHPERQ